MIKTQITVVKSLYSPLKQGVFQGVLSRVDKSDHSPQASSFLLSALVSLVHGFHSQGFLVVTDDCCSCSGQIHVLGQCSSNCGL